MKKSKGQSAGTIRDPAEPQPRAPAPEPLCWFFEWRLGASVSTAPQSGVSGICAASGPRVAEPLATPPPEKPPRHQWRSGGLAGSEGLLILTWPGTEARLLGRGRG